MGQMIFATNTLGGLSTLNKLSQKMRMQAQPLFVYRQFCETKEGGKNQGDIVYFDKMVQLDTQGGTLTETSTIPKNLIKMTRGSVQVERYGNGCAFTEKLELLAEFDMRNKYTQWLVTDHKRVTDSACAAKFVTAKFRAVCTSTSSTVFTTNGTFTATQAANMSDKNVRDIVDYMKQKWIPKYAGGNEYIAIVSCNARRGLYDQMQVLSQYAEPEFRFNAEVGRYYDTRFVEENSYLSNSRGSGTQYGEAIFFGGDAVVEAVALPEEVRYQEDDFGCDKQLAWVGYLGWAKMWDTGDDINSVGKGFERIVYMGSV